MVHDAAARVVGIVGEPDDSIALLQSGEGPDPAQSPGLVSRGARGREALSGVSARRVSPAAP